MIIGDRGELAFEIDRLEVPWEIADPHEESVWGALGLWVAGKNLSDHLRSGTDRVRTDLHLPLLPLARWMRAARAALRYEERSPLGASSIPHEELDRWSAGREPPAGATESDWLDLRDRWWSEHFTGAAAPNVVAPSIGIVRNDDRACVSWRIPALPRADREFVHPAGSEVVSWSVVESALDEFVAAVASWAPEGVAVGDEHAVTGALEYYTGLEAGDLADFDFLPDAADDPAVDPLAQVVRDLTRGTSTGPARDTIVSGVRDVGRSSGQAWWHLRRRMALAADQSYEQQGHDGAQAARQLLGLDGEPVDDVDALLQDLDIVVSADSPPSDSDRMVVAGASGGNAAAMILGSARTAKPWARRFELARALAHLLLDHPRGGAIGAASGPRAMASRRRRAGAFAAELLLPTSALAEASHGALDGVLHGQRFEQLLDRFVVGANAAAHHLFNQGFLSSPEVRDDLIASALK